MLTCMTFALDNDDDVTRSQAGLGQSHEVLEFLDSDSSDYNEERARNMDARRRDPTTISNVARGVVNLPGKGLKKVFGLGKFVVGEVGGLATRTFGSRARKGGDAPTKMKFVKRSQSKVKDVDPFARYLEQTEKSARYTARPVCLKALNLLPAESLLEDADRFASICFDPPLFKGAATPHQRPLDAVACCSLLLLTCAPLMTSSHSKAENGVLR